MFGAVLLHRYPMSSKPAFFGQPADKGGVGKYASATCVIWDSLVTKINRGSADLSSSGMNVAVTTFLPAALKS